MHELLPFISGIHKTDIAITAVFDLIIERIQYWKSKYKESLVENDWTDRNIVYDLKVFEPLFLALLTNEITATHLEQLLLKHDLKNKETAKVFLKIAQQKGSKKDWAVTAESFAENDETIMRQLFERYAKEGSEKNLYRIAKKAFQFFPSRMYESIFEVIQPEVDKEFYTKVLSFYVVASRNIEKYRTLQTYLNQDQRICFVEQHKNWMDFHVEMLAEEAQYEKILAIVKKHPSRADGWSSSEGKLNNIILPILNVYPKECFEMLQTRVKEALRTGRGRGVYAGVAKWMQLLLKIKGYEAQARQFIDDLVVEFRNFRALKEEMREAGVI